MPREGSNAFYRAYADRWYLDKANKDNYLYRSSASKIGLSGGLVIPDLETLDGIDLSVHAADLAAHTKNPLQILMTGDTYIPGSFGWYTAVANIAFLANTLYAHPFIVVRNITVDRIAIQVGTLATAASARLGIYQNGTNLYPGALVLDAGTVSVASTGVKTITISQALTKGFYWLALVSNGAPSIYTWYETANILGLSSAGFDSPKQGWSVAFTYAALPDPFTTGGTLIHSAVPGIALRPLSLD